MTANGWPLRSRKFETAVSARVKSTLTPPFEDNAARRRKDYPVNVRRRRLRALQVEVTSRCGRRCAICPQSALAERWLEGDISEAMWARLRPDLRLARHVHLQGWGEPLLHDKVESMARDAREAGCRVGVTTNGDGLVEASAWILDGPLDILAISVAGAGDQNRRLRDGASMDDLLDIAADLLHRRRRRPRLHLSYLLTRTNTFELEGVVREAAEAGIDAVLVNHVDCTPSAAIRRLAVWDGGRVDDGVLDALAAAERVAKERRLELRLPATAAEEMLTCDLDPRRIVSVRWDGRLAPCVMLNLPIDGPVPRVVDGELVGIDARAIAHLDQVSLREYLEGDCYREFVTPLQRRMDADARYRKWGLVASGWGVVGLRDLDRAYAELEAALECSPFPPACDGCPKADGW
jgi:MoaA/NifB/PqqE/SkfB family radical SAM enzyme